MIKKHALFSSSSIKELKVGKSKRLLSFCILFMFMVMSLSAQQLAVRGTVTDENGEPLIGANVTEKGTTNGVMTDVDGSFTLSVSPDAVLTISYVGYLGQEVKAVSGTNMTIKLFDDTKALDEIVIVGFGTQRKVNLTGSVGIATAKEIESRPVSSATQALQGLIPGLKITTNSGKLDNAMDISVRGLGTIGEGSNGSPLILIDGMQGDLNNINPQDIENISVLKDAAASSIYGSRAPFGVILVTTKKGAEGKTSINYNNSFRVAKPINMPKAMDSYTFANMMNEAARHQGVNPDYTDEVMQKMLDYQAGKLQYGLDPSADGTKWEDRWTKGYANTDIWKETFKSSVFSQEHNLSITGGSNKISYYTSFNYLDQGGLLNFGEEAMKRYNLTGKINATLTDWLKFNFSTRFTRRDETRPTAFVDTYFETLGRGNWPNVPIFDRNGHINHDDPRKLAEGGQRTYQHDRNYYQGAFIIEPLKNWVTNVEFNYSINEISTKAVSLTTYNYDPAGNRLDNGSQNTNLKENDQKENYLNFNLYSTYSRTFAENHNFKIMGGFQAEERKYHYFDATKYGLLSNELTEFDLTNGLSGKGEAMESIITGNSNEWATAGFFGRLNYDYKGRYLAEVNLRYDGSSRFRRNERWLWSPSFSLGWNIAHEKFFEPINSTVNQLKFRFSYGELGNQNTNAYYPTYRTITLSSTGDWLQNGKRTNTAEVGSLISTSLTWETVQSYNIGLDFGLFNNRLSGSFDYFTRYTKNMVGPAPQLPITLGLDPPKTNNCDLKTRGWEISISWRDRLKNGLGYGITANISDQETYIDSYPGNKTGSIDQYMSGKKVGLIWGYETIGIAKSQQEMDNHLSTLPNGGQNELGTQWAAGDIMYKDIDGDGKISEGARTWNDHGDLKVLGDANPHYFFGVDLTADWKGIDFRCFLQGVLKHDYWPGESSYFWGVRGGYSKWFTIGLEEHNDYFREQPVGLAGNEIPANLDSYFPRPIFSASSNGNSFGSKNQKIQTRYMQNAAYMRLKNLQVGYTLPSVWTQKIGISKCRVYVSGENLITFTSLFDVFDPETCTGGWGGNSYPLSRTWSFGLSVTL
jgi:TonB-linked SusC/RagA family outer membrane protein